MLSNGVLRSGNGGVAAKLCLEEPIWPPICLRKGWPSGGDDHYVLL